MSPIYEYECSFCGNIFSKMSSIDKSNNNMYCPACNKPSKRILSSGLNFILKGKDWPGKDIKEKNGNK